MTDNTLGAIAASLARMAQALEAMQPAVKPEAPALDEADAYHWDAASGSLIAVPKVSRVPLDLLQGISDVRDILLQNTLQFANGFSANNALLWGARGMGKSSLVKAIHAHVAETERAKRLVLI